MSSKKPAPAVASTGCSSLMSCLSLQRRGQPPQPAPAPARRSDALPPRRSRDTEAAERMQLLEEEIERLSKWLDHKARPAPAAESVVRGDAQSTREKQGAMEATNCTRNGAKASEEKRSTATAAASKRCGGAGDHGGQEQDTVRRLEDRSYLREIKRVGRPWDRLAVQVSRPVSPVDAASVSEVLDKMAAIRAEDLVKLLTKMMPLKDINGQQNPGGEPVRRTGRLSSGDDLVEALVLRAMDKLDSLVLEGIKIQMASPATEPAAAGDRRRDKAAMREDCMVHMVLMQVRDPSEGYSAIGDSMIGLIEASLETKDGKVKLELQGLHVAGISFVSRKPSDGRCMMWSASLIHQCRGSHGGGAGDDGGGCRCTCVRNPNRVFQR